MKNSTKIFLLLFVLIAFVTTGATDQALNSAVMSRTSDMENNNKYQHSASCDSMIEDTANCLWDGVDDSIITRGGRAYYLGATMNMLGNVMVSMRAATNSDTDTLVLGAVLQHGVRGIDDRGDFEFDWFEEYDTLFWFTDTATGAASIVQDNTVRFFSDMPANTTDITTTKLAGDRVLANSIRLITFWPDSNYLHAYALTKEDNGKVYLNNALNTGIRVIYTKMDSLR